MIQKISTKRKSIEKAVFFGFSSSALLNGVVLLIIVFFLLTNGLEAISFDFLTKPLDFEDLVLTVRKTLYEVGKLRELDRKHKEELKKRMTTEEALGSIDPAKLREILDKHIQ